MPRTLHCTLPDLAATDRLARALADALAPGDVVLLTGDLGAGKTTLVRAIAGAAGVDTRLVSSPTFTVMNEYRGGRIDPITHLDAYRLSGEDEAELLQLGWDPGATESDTPAGVSFVEWGERIEDLLATMLVAEPARIALAHAEDGGRTATLRIPDYWDDRPGLAALIECAKALAADQPDPPGYPFGSEREQLADLYHWFGESYKVSRPLEQSDFDE